MRRLLPLTLLLALLASACSLLGEAPAATVDGHEITVDAVSDEIDIIEANRAYREVIEDSYGKPITGEGTFDAAFAAQLLTASVYYEVIDRDLERRGVELTEDDIAAATSAIENEFQTLPEALEAFPDDYRDEIIRRRAMIDVVQAEISESIGDDPMAFYEQDPEQFAEICVSHALVGLQGGRTPDEARSAAKDLYDRIQDGEDFETIATDESDDPGAAAEGGALGCGSRVTLQFDPTFLEAAFALEEGVVSEPVLTQFGAHLIYVTSREIPTYREVADQVPSFMQTAQSTRVNDYFTDLICGADVEVNSRYGRWLEESCDGLAPRPPTVEAPEGPRQAPTEDTTFEL